MTSRSPARNPPLARAPVAIRWVTRLTLCRSRSRAAERR